MRIVLIGAGRLAVNLGRALLRKGHEVTYVLGRSKETTSALAAMLQCPCSTNMADMPIDADMYMVCVNDEALPAVVASMPPLSALVVHTAGSLSMQVFEGTSLSRYGIFYPMQTFSKEVAADFSDIPCFIEASDKSDLNLLESFSRTLTHRVFRLSSEKRRYLHLAAVFACNFSNYCYAVAGQLLAENGLPFDVMLPLIDQTARKVHSIAPLEAQTGPAARGDKAVMEAQAALLDNHPALKEIYRLMSNGIQSVVQQKSATKRMMTDDKL